MWQNNDSSVVLDGRGIRIGNKYEVLLCASVFYFRLPACVWKDRIAKLKAVGYNCADVYFPWNYHEKEDGSFDFTGEKDIEEFLRILYEAGLYVIARPGPYICSEWTGGAIPARILEAGIPIRCADKRFICEAETWYRAVLPVIAAKEYGRGGSVIAIQLENELDFFDCNDPERYIGALRDCARNCGITVPLFCCCGQYGAEQAGALTDGVALALNCYPESSDLTFDYELRGYALYLEGNNRPLLISETNRDHFLLRRELSCGAKLLGAYNQVAGVNFDYNQSVNNWGKPESFLATEYDFESMIDAAGNYRREAIQALYFSAFLHSLGEEIAEALPAGTIIPTYCEFPFPKGGMNRLRLKSGGYAVCVPNFGKSDGRISFNCEGKEVSASVRAGTAPFFLFGLDLNPFGIPVKILSSACELICAKKDMLAFRAGPEAAVALDFGDGERCIAASCTLYGVKIRMLDDAEAAEFLSGKEKIVPAQYISQRIESVGFSMILPEMHEIAGGTTFGSLGMSDGEAEYELAITPGRKLYVERPCDILTVLAKGCAAESQVADGRDVVLPSADDGRYIVRIEKWGHSNFDDPQALALRISGSRGALSFGEIVTEVKLGRCCFKLLDEFGSEQIDTSTRFPVRLSVHSWNSTRKPVNCAYSFEVCRTTDRLILHVSDAAEIAVYVAGKLIGMCDFGRFDLTPHLEQGKRMKVTLVYRKKVWTQCCGETVLYGVRSVSPHVRVLSGKQMRDFVCRSQENRPFPVALQAGTRASFALNVSDLGEEGFLRFRGNNLRLTCIMGGRVVARLLVGWENAPQIVGGDPEKMYYCPAWRGANNLLSVYAEAAGENAVLEGIDYLYSPAGSVQ